MGYVVAREVTCPVHGADGSVVFRPGDRLPMDKPVPEGVPYRLVVAGEPDPEPEPATDLEPEPKAARPARGAAKGAR